VSLAIGRGAFRPVVLKLSGADDVACLGIERDALDFWLAASYASSALDTTNVPPELLEKIAVRSSPSMRRPVSVNVIVTVRETAKERFVLSKANSVGVKLKVPEAILTNSPKSATEDVKFWIKTGVTSVRAKNPRRILLRSKAHRPRSEEKSGNFKQVPAKPRTCENVTELA
jgi:hypothetical protein